MLEVMGQWEELERDPFPQKPKAFPLRQVPLLLFWFCYARITDPGRRMEARAEAQAEAGGGGWRPSGDPYASFRGSAAQGLAEASQLSEQQREAFAELLQQLRSYRCWEYQQAHRIPTAEGMELRRRLRRAYLYWLWLSHWGPYAVLPYRRLKLLWRSGSLRQLGSVLWLRQLLLGQTSCRDLLWVYVADLELRRVLPNQPVSEEMLRERHFAL